MDQENHLTKIYQQIYLFLRRRIRDPRLRCEELSIGTQTNTKVVISYIEGIVNNNVLNEVYRRVQNIQIDTILETGYIEQLIEDAPLSLFPTIGNTEKPDIVAAQLLEGRVILVDGTPLVLLIPYLLANNFQVSEDYYSRTIFVNFIRVLRVLSFFYFCVLLPGAYVAVLYYHDPCSFYFISQTTALRTEVPFQLYIEITLMLLVFEIIRDLTSNA
ncbi:spore germination protein [Anaerobacillus sp. HL2]|nr:spore germination protein [Anaerobacillus sp. HL2]